MKNYLIIGLFLALLVSLFGNWIQHDLLNSKASGEEATKSGLKLEIEQLKAGTLIREAQIQELRQKSDSTTVKNKALQIASKAEIKALRKRERSGRIDTVTVSLTDTIFARQDSVILAVESDRDRIVAECQAIADSLTAQANDFKSISVKEGQRADIAEAGEKRQRKKGKWLTRGLIASGVLIVYQIFKPE